MIAAKEKSMEKIVMASNNRHKIGELAAFLAALCPLAKDGEPYAFLSLDDIGYTAEIVEDGDTFEANALIKARTVAALGYIGVADDSGLMVDALGGAPGVHSARYTGRHEDSDAARYTLLLHNLGDRTDRTARFVSCICCTFPNGDVLRARGTCEGSILFAPRGENGFGYDPVFQPDGYACSMAELRPEEKNAISHRGNALKILKEELRNYYADK